jgi:O-antigen/teichoic acid export membrane protein
MAMAFILFGHALLAALFNREVAEYSRYLPLVALIGLAGFWDSHLGCGLTVLRRFRTQMVILTLRVLVATPITLMLTRQWSLAGALIACAIYPLISVVPFGVVIASEYRRARHAHPPELSVSAPAVAKSG